MNPTSVTLGQRVKAGPFNLLKIERQWATVIERRGAEWFVLKFADGTMLSVHCDEMTPQVRG